MKELINIVNSKIQAVVDELKNQKQALEQKLNTVDKDIETKVIAASNCKNKVATASNTISELEAEIVKLKNDLQELHNKFDSAGFTELLEAGNKEINGKIIENNTKISEQQDLIKNLSDEAQSIKDELAALQDSKNNLENELKNTKIALMYYSKKIDDMTITAIENSDKLSEMVISEEENNEAVDVDVNKVIDGTIFDEIDSISSTERDFSEQELENILNAKTEEEVKEEPQETTNVMEEQPQEFTPVVEEQPEYTHVVEEEPQEEVVENIEVQPEIPTEPVFPVEPNESQIEETFTNNMNNDLEPSNDYNYVQPMLDTNTTDDEDTVIIPTEEIKNQVNTEETSSISSTFADINNNLGDSNEKIDEIGLDASKFDEIDLNILRKNLDVDHALKIINILDKHFINIENIYQNPEILITMEPEVLDEELDVLEHLGCINTTIEYIFKYLDKINLNKLKELDQGQTDSIIKVLYDCVSEKESINISEVLGLSEEQTTVLESNLDAKEYNIFCTFPEVIKANFDTIVNLHVQDPIRCIIEHPKRYMNNPDVFDDILDKYDTPDLVRCINKNPAVIDKL